MSKGTAKITVRMDKTLKDAIGDYLKKRDKIGGGIEPWTFTTFLLQAVKDKLNHLERSRRSGIKWTLTKSDECLAAKLEAHWPSPLLNGENMLEAAAIVETIPKNPEQLPCLPMPENVVDDGTCPW